MRALRGAERAASPTLPGTGPGPGRSCAALLGLHQCAAQISRAGSPVMPDDGGAVLSTRGSSAPLIGHAPLAERVKPSGLTKRRDWTVSPSRGSALRSPAPPLILTSLVCRFAHHMCSVEWRAGAIARAPQLRSSAGWPRAEWAVGASGRSAVQQRAKRAQLLVATSSYALHVCKAGRACHQAVGMHAPMTASL